MWVYLYSQGTKAYEVGFWMNGMWRPQERYKDLDLARSAVCYLNGGRGIR